MFGKTLLDIPDILAEDLCENMDYRGPVWVVFALRTLWRDWEVRDAFPGHVEHWGQESVGNSRTLKVPVIEKFPCVL